MIRTAAILLCIITLGHGAITWTTTTPLPRVSWRHACASANGRVYFLGGGEGPSADCHVAKVDAGGPLGPWSATASLPTALGWFSCEATQDHIYVVGGWNSSGLTNVVRYAGLDSVGNIGAWQATTSLPTNLYTQGGVLVDSVVYVIGGATGVGSPVVSDVRYSHIQPDGSLGSWTTTTSLPGPLRIMGAAATATHVYSVGGRPGASATDAVYYAAINPDGSLGAWNATTSLPTAQDGNTAVVVGSRLYSVTGLSSTAVYSAGIQPDGSLGAWETETSLPGVRWAADGLATGNRIYIPGGYAPGAVSTVYYSSELTGIAESPVGPARPALALAPTAARPGARLRLSGLDGPAKVRLLDAAGRTRLTARAVATFSCPELEPGVYFLQVVGREANLPARLTVLP